MPRPFACAEEALPYGAADLHRAGAAGRRARPGPIAPRPEAVAAYPLERSLLQADGLALALRAALDRISIPLARACAAFASSHAWAPFGFARLEDHARERFRRSGRWVRDLAALGDALVRLPLLVEALAGADGGRPVGRVAAVLLGRCASPASLDAWLALARSSTVRDLREAVRRARAAASEWPLAEPVADDRPPQSGASSKDGAPGGAGHPATDIGVGARHAAPDVGAEDSSEPERVLVRLPVPAPVLAAFDEAVDLYRAVEGHEATVTSFIEALLAEASGADPDLQEAAFPTAGQEAAVAGAELLALRRSEALAAVEAALARSTGHWRHLAGSPGPSWALSLAGTSLARLEAIDRSAGSGGPAGLDRQIRDLAELEDEMEARLGRLLAEMGERGAWPRLRFAGVGHYAEERLGLSRTAGEDRARLARALRSLPLVRDAYERGRIGAAVAGLIGRLLDGGPVDRATERQWLARAEEATVKRLRDEARALGRAALIGRGASPGLGRGVSIDRGRGAPLACNIETSRGSAADSSPDRDAPRPLDDATWHASLRREVGTATRRLARWGASLVASDASPLPAPDVFLRMRLPEDLAGRFLSTIDAARRALAHQVESVEWDEPWPDPHARPSLLAARTFSTRSRRVPAWTGLLSLLEEFVFTWDADQGGTRRPGQEIYVREGWRCAAPGCTSRRHLEDHHLTYRSHGGSDDASNRTCLCRFHHQRGEHGGLARCRGAAPLGIVWRLGTPPLATWFRNERRIEAPPPDAAARRGGP